MDAKAVGKSCTKGEGNGRPNRYRMAKRMKQEFVRQIMRSAERLKGSRLNKKSKFGQYKKINILNVYLSIDLCDEFERKEIINRHYSLTNLSK